MFRHNVLINEYRAVGKWIHIKDSQMNSKKRKIENTDKTLKAKNTKNSTKNSTKTPKHTKTPYQSSIKNFFSTRTNQSDDSKMRIVKSRGTHPATAHPTQPVTNQLQT